MSFKYQLGLIGAGNMAEAVARAAVDKGVLRAGDMIAADPAEARRKVFADMGSAVTDDNAQVMAQAQQILLAVKPQTFSQVGAALGRLDADRQVVISIMAGIPTGQIAAASGKALRVVRVMPNTPLLVGLGMSGVALGAQAQAGDEALTLRLFGAGGAAVVVDEALIDAITAVSGSGPAYVFYLAEAMEKAAGALGLAAHARLLVRQTILGAARLLSDSPDTAAELRRKVTSPGGTTEAAIKHLDANKTTDVIANAVKAARNRSVALGKA